MNRNPKCHDCGLSYDDDGFQDLIIPDWAWHAISPKGNDGGLLCPTCICRALERVKIKNCPSAFTSGSLAFDIKSWIR